MNVGTAQSCRFNIGCSSGADIERSRAGAVCAVPQHRSTFGAEIVRRGNLRNRRLAASGSVSPRGSSACMLVTGAAGFGRTGPTLRAPGIRLIYIFRAGGEFRDSALACVFWARVELPLWGPDAVGVGIEGFFERQLRLAWNATG